MRRSCNRRRRDPAKLRTKIARCATLTQQAEKTISCSPTAWISQTAGRLFHSRHRFESASVTNSPPAALTPRNYPAGVSIVKRSARGAASAPARLSVADIEHWLLHDAALEREMLLTFESFIWRMVAAGLPIDRASLHIGTLHPQLL